MALKTLYLKIAGMHCTGCEQTIEDAMSVLPGISKIAVSYERGEAVIDFDDEFIREAGIRQAIVAKGYEIPEQSAKKFGTVLRLLIFIGLLLVVGGVAFWGKSLMPGLLPHLNAGMSNAMLFSIGVLTGFHCIGMCGSFVVGYADQSLSAAKAALAHLAYGVGKTASYSAIGAAFGLAGAAVTITPYMRGVAALAAGVFLLVYGLKMLDLIPALRRFTLRLPGAYSRGVNNSLKAQRNPLLIGLLSGLLLGCGPLQAMYVMAAGTGSPQEGAVLLFFFGLGTLVPLLGFGFFATFLSRHTIHTLVKVSGVLVIVMGVMMADRGLTMTRSGFDFGSLRMQIEQAIRLSEHKP